MIKSTPLHAHEWALTLVRHKLSFTHCWIEFQQNNNNNNNECNLRNSFTLRRMIQLGWFLPQTITKMKAFQPHHPCMIGMHPSHKGLKLIPLMRVTCQHNISLSIYGCVCAYVYSSIKIMIFFNKIMKRQQYQPYRTNKNSKNEHATATENFINE